MQAFVEGKTIQRYDDKKDDWYDISPNANIDFCYDYRIKPEPKYRPFKSQEECWQEMHQHPDFGWLKSKHNGSVGLIGTLYKKDEVPMIIWATNEFNHFSSSYLFDEYVFTDGEPFGIKEE